METGNNPIKKYDADTMACIQSAYEDLQLMIKEIFTNLMVIQNQLSFEEFVSIFEKYDWNDIIDSIEEICPPAKNDYRKSLNDLILIQLHKSNSQQLSCIERNSYFREYEF